MSSYHVARLGEFERIFIEKDALGLTLFHRSLKVAHSFLPIFYLTGSDGICGVSLDEVECHLLGSYLLQDQRLDPQVYTHIYD